MSKSSMQEPSDFHKGRQAFRNGEALEQLDGEVAEGWLFQEAKVISNYLSECQAEGMPAPVALQVVERKVR